MIAALRGEVIHIGLDHGVIDCAGVGYKFLATPKTLGTLRRGEQATVLTNLVVKEDSLTLYGFSADEDREMFHKLQTVTGLGPKLAIAALSVFDAAELSTHIAAGDAKKIQTIPGVGKKMAERMVLELKDKVEAPLPDGGTGGAEAASRAGGASSYASEQVVEALVGLGFPERSARPVVEQLIADEPERDASALLRQALTQLGKK